MIRDLRWGEEIMEERSHWTADALRCLLAIVAGFSIAIIAGTVWAEPDSGVDRPGAASCP